MEKVKVDWSPAALEQTCIQWFRECVRAEARALQQLPLSMQAAIGKLAAEGYNFEVEMRPGAKTSFVLTLTQR